MTRGRARRRSGISIVETVVATALSIIVLLPLTSLVRSASDSSSDVDAATGADAQARRAAGRVAEQFRRAGMDTAALVPETPAWTSEASFDAVLGVDPGTGSPSWQPVRIAWVADATDPDNGVDDDGDGSADEGSLVLTMDDGLSGARATVLAGSVAEFLDGELPNGLDDNGNGLVDESGFCATRTGPLVTVRVTVVRGSSTGGRRSCTAEAVVRVRN